MNFCFVNLALAILGVQIACAATTAPLGFYAIKVAGSGDGGVPSRTYVGVQLMPPTLFQGSVTAVDTNTLSFDGVPTLGDSDREYYVQVLSGSGSGFIAGISSSDSTDLVCESDMSSWANVGDLVSIRYHPFLMDLVSDDNRFGFGAGEDADSADNVVLWDAEFQAERTFYFHSLRNRWEEKGVVADANQVMVKYPLGFYIVRRAPGAIRFAVSGELASDDVLLPVSQGANIFSLPVNLSASLEQLFSTDGGYSAIDGANAAQADMIDVYEASTGLRRGPFYLRSGTSGPDWREVGNPSSTLSTQPIDMLSTLVLSRSGTQGGYLRAKASLEPPALGMAPVVSADPEIGELPIEMEFPLPPVLPPGVVLTLQTSTDLVEWTSYPYSPGPSGGVLFQLPPGQSRAFYRVEISLAP